ncbi:MAG: 5'/3'-nucleotidase SurE [Deltaproteobacteria bacterium]|nr:5'/3'-nucleotidase SurE [Deltaproteobacteria bacterium]MBI4373394.1 5'/3'-nucleotidase SurE [Deltaproteobacteria bacterium]
MKKPLILVSNDDGYQSGGIETLARVLRPLAHVVVVAPEHEQSASSHSLTLHRPLRIRHRETDLYTVDGTPTDCIFLAIHRVLKRRPDLIVSGVNWGANLGEDVHYSGTVSAAVEGALVGVPSIAFSLVVWRETRPIWSTAGEVAKKICKQALKEKISPGMVLNVNIPNVKISCLKGMAFTRVGKRDYGQVIFDNKDPRGRKYYWIGGHERVLQRIPGTDCSAILARKVSITPLKIDLTDHQYLMEKETQLF